MLVVALKIGDCIRIGAKTLCLVRVNRPGDALFSIRVGPISRPFRLTANRRVAFVPGVDIALSTRGFPSKVRILLDVSGSVDIGRRYSG